MGGLEENTEVDSPTDSVEGPSPISQAEPVKHVEVKGRHQEAKEMNGDGDGDVEGEEESSSNHVDPRQGRKKRDEISSSKVKATFKSTKKRTEPSQAERDGEGEESLSAMETQAPPE